MPANQVGFKGQENSEGSLDAVESTVFALLAGFSNFGYVVSSYLGAYVLDYIGMADIGKGAEDDFRCEAAFLSLLWGSQTYFICPRLIIFIEENVRDAVIFRCPRQDCNSHQLFVRDPWVCKPCVLTHT